MAVDFIPEGVFLRAKPVNAIIALHRGEREWYASSLAKEIDCTFPHIIKLLSLFEEQGFVSFKPEGRKKLVFLTPKGQKVAAEFSRLAAILK